MVSNTPEYSAEYYKNHRDKMRDQMKAGNARRKLVKHDDYDEQRALLIEKLHLGLFKRIPYKKLKKYGINAVVEIKFV